MGLFGESTQTIAVLVFHVIIKNLSYGAEIAASSLRPCMEPEVSKVTWNTSCFLIPVTVISSLLIPDLDCSAFIVTVKPVPLKAFTRESILVSCVGFCLLRSSEADNTPCGRYRIASCICVLFRLTWQSRNTVLQYANAANRQTHSEIPNWDMQIHTRYKNDRKLEVSSSSAV